MEHKHTVWQSAVIEMLKQLLYLNNFGGGGAFLPCLAVIYSDISDVLAAYKVT